MSVAKSIKNACLCILLCGLRLPMQSYIWSDDKKNVAVKDKLYLENSTHYKLKSVNLASNQNEFAAKAFTL